MPQKIREEVQEDVHRIQKALEAHGAAVRGGSVEDPRVEEIEAEMREEEFHQRIKADPTLEALWQKIEVLERRATESEQQNQDLRAELEREKEFGKKIAEQQGLDREWMEFSANAWNEDQQFKRDLKRIQEEQNDRCVVVVMHNSDPTQNGPIRGSINSVPFRVARGVPTLVNSSIAEALYFMRRVGMERYTDPQGQKKTRIVHDRRAAFTLMPPGAQARASALAA